MRDVHIMDIAVNLARIGNWAADDFDGKKPRILQFLRQTAEYVRRVNLETYPPALQQAIQSFRPVYQRLAREAQTRPRDVFAWAEAIMTWGNILTHRAKLTESAL